MDPSKGACSANFVSGDGMSDVDIAETDPAGRYIRYNEIIGRGAHKTVYKGFDGLEGIEIAWNQMKMAEFLRSPENLERAYSEIHLLKHVKHENIIKFYTSWVDEKTQTINIITELFTSGNLRQYRKKHKNVDMKALKNWARQILRGLDYLHSHNLPIIHRDLKCDNIFVNGNHGEVKIGDLGLAVIMQQSNARSVIGTPEFMAPELYEEDYTELVDIYSFGMCILEMVTFDYPYNECRNAAQIYKKVTSGIKPAALAKVTNPEIKQFIEKCLLPPSERLPAKELLKDPFLQPNISKELPLLMQPQYCVPSTVNSNPEPLYMDIDSRSSSFATVNGLESTNGNSFVPELEYQRNNMNKEFRLGGKRGKDDEILLSLRIAQICGPVKNIHFPFYLDNDTAMSIAREMVEQLELPDCDVVFIAEFIDFLIDKLVPGWSPFCDCTMSGMTSPYTECEVDANVQSSCASPWKLDTETGMEQTGTSYLTCSNYVEECVHVADTNNCSIIEGDDKVSQGSALSVLFMGSSLSRDFSDCDMGCVYDSGNKGMGTESTIITPVLGKEGSSQESLSRIDSSLSLPIGLRRELDMIDVEFDRRLVELSRMREQAMEDARKRWLKGKSVIG